MITPDEDAIHRPSGNLADVNSDPNRMQMTRRAAISSSRHARGFRARCRQVKLTLAWVEQSSPAQILDSGVAVLGVNNWFRRLDDGT